MTQTFEERRAIERQVIQRVITDALADPTLYLSAEEAAPTRDEKVLLDEIFSVDEARLYYHRNGEPTAYGWVFFVLGNSGWDVICDYTTTLEPLLAGANALADTLEG
jgi:hypothetical protein